MYSMNERIKELALEARVVYYSKNGAYEGADEGLSVIPSTQSLEKFAESLIRECANTLTIRASYYTSCSSDDPTTAEWFSGTVNGLKEGADLIKNHFGVE